MTTEDFVERALKVHGGFYTYENVNYVNNRAKVDITCPIHGSFWQSPANHIHSKSGCPACGYARAGRRVTLDEFITRSRAVHGNRYSYDKVVLDGTKTPVVIGCPVHGDFSQSPANHMNGAGCVKCSYDRISREKTKSQEEFILQSREKHGDTYDYSEVDYRGDGVKVTILCPTHGAFLQTPNKHLQGQGCPSCAPNRTLLKEDFIYASKQVHGEKYGYDKISDRVGVMARITCPVHGDFLQRPYDHLGGHGCRKCYDDSKEGMDFSTYLSKYGRPGWKYEGYSGYFDPLTVTCAEHGLTFTVTGHVHASAHHGGCPKCQTVSAPHKAVIDMLVGEEMMINTYQIIPPKQLDIYLPEYRVGIEINGLYYHKFMPQMYHQEKFEACEAAGIQLVQIWDSEIRDNPELVESFLLNLIGKSKTRIYARECVTEDISQSEYSAFLKDNHLEGGRVMSKERKGLRYNGSLVAVMGFTGDTLQRFCSLKFTNVVGGFSKLLKSFNRDHVVTYSDNRYSLGNVYNGHGFRKVRETRSRLFITNNTDIFGRRRFQRRYLVNFPGYSEEKTAEEILNENGLHYIYGPGTRKWELCYPPSTS
ncbi:MAG: DUF723 domain-containing protein [Thiohalomonadaceae bacterium]